MSDAWALSADLKRIADALERIVYLLETEPINVKIPTLHPSITVPPLDHGTADD